MSDKPANLATALALLQTRLPEIKKSETAEVVTQKGTYSYSYANLAGISEAILPLLGELGLSFIAKPTFVDGRFVLAYSLLHVSGQREDGEYPLPSTGTPQAIGSAITYGRRYCLCAVTGVAPEEDDDASAAEAEAAANRGTAQRASTPRKASTRPPTAGHGPTVQRARPDAGTPPPLPHEPERANQGQVGIIVSKFDDLGVADRAERLRITASLVGRHLTSARELTKAEAHTLIEKMDAASKQDDPFAWLNQQAKPPDGGGS